MLLNKAYYTFKFLLPRRLQIRLRRYYVNWKRPQHAGIWPIDPNGIWGHEGIRGHEGIGGHDLISPEIRIVSPYSPAPENGDTIPNSEEFGSCPHFLWPNAKKFALVLTHDVESAQGLDKCYQLAEIEERLGFRSSFGFVPGDYAVPAALRQSLTERGFEIAVHGLHHDQNPFRSASIFKKQAVEINRYLKEWGSVGFRSPSMYHDLELLHHLDIEYDASTFDTDPFEPQPDGMGTIFPFWVPNQDPQKGYVELPYTLPQDFLLFILMQEKNTDIWKKKLNWIAEHGGMVLINAHPNYMNFNATSHYEEYPAKYYEEFLEYIKSKYEGQYWHALPRDMARYWAGKTKVSTPSTLAPKPLHLPSRPSPATRHPSPVTTLVPLHACMLVYSFYESDNRVMRYAETLLKRGDLVDVIALRKDGQPFHEVLRGVNVYRIQGRIKNEKGQLSFLYRLIKFLIVSSIFLAKQHRKKAYQLIHVNNIPDFLVFAALFPKLKGAKVILDVHDIVPELYADMFNQTQDSLLFKALVAVEKASCAFADHVIIANHIWHKLITTRSVAENKCSVVLNYPDENVFFKRPRQRQDDKLVMIYPGSLNRRQGVDIAVKAFGLIKDKIPMAEFHIYGTGTDMDNLKRLIIDLALQDRVFLKGALPIYEVADRMANADLGIEPKRNEMFAGDAMSTKILEFMSLGLPVIASDTRVHKYYFDDSVVLFFKSDDEQELARCMLLLIEDESLRKKMLLNSQQFVQGYVWEKRKEEYLGLIDRLTQGAR